MTCLPLRKVLAMFQALYEWCMDFSQHLKDTLRTFLARFVSWIRPSVLVSKGDKHLHDGSEKGLLECPVHIATGFSEFVRIPAIVIDETLHHLSSLKFAVVWIYHYIHRSDCDCETPGHLTCLNIWLNIDVGMSLFEVSQ